MYGRLMLTVVDMYNMLLVLVLSYAYNRLLLRVLSYKKDSTHLISKNPDHNLDQLFADKKSLNNNLPRGPEHRHGSRCL